MKVAAIIPARHASTRFPGKPLADILGQPMIQRVYLQVAQARSLSRVIVATDDARIAAAVRAFGGEVQLTRVDHATGTDRLAEVASGLDADLIVNVQGDEPLIEPAVIDAAVAPLLADPTLAMGTLMTRLHSREEFLNPNVVKVVTDDRGDALYFSRAPIPFPRDLAADLPAELTGIAAFRHIGLYVYRRDFLLCFATWPEGRLEALERLEQLRVLERGERIRVVETAHAAIGVDTPADLRQVVDILRNRGERICNAASGGEGAML